MNRVVSALVLLTSQLTLVANAGAMCGYLDIVDVADQVPYFVRARVMQVSNADTQIDCKTDAIFNTLLQRISSSEASDRDNEACSYEFEVTVIEVFKGTLDTKRLRFASPDILGCPGADTFSVGDDYIFAIQSIDSAGNARLAYHACGHSGFPASSKERMRKLVDKLGGAG